MWGPHTMTSPKPTQSSRRGGALLTVLWLSAALAAIGFAKAKRRRQIMIATSSIGPGALNMITAAGVAHANRLPILILSGDTFTNRRPDPVMQQVERVVQQFGGVSQVRERVANSEGLESKHVRRLGLPGRFVEHAERNELLESLGLLAAGIASSAKECLARHAPDRLAEAKESLGTTGSSPSPRELDRRATFSPR